MSQTTRAELIQRGRQTKKELQTVAYSDAAKLQGILSDVWENFPNEELTHERRSLRREMFKIPDDPDYTIVLHLEEEALQPGRRFMAYAHYFQVYMGEEIQVRIRRHMEQLLLTPENGDEMLTEIATRMGEPIRFYLYGSWVEQVLILPRS